MDESDRYRRKDDDSPKRSPIGGKGGSVDDKICLLCGVFHPPVFSLRKEDVDRVEVFKPKLPSWNTLPALFTVCSLAGKVAPGDACCQEVAEHAIRFMLTQGANWVNTEQNQRAQGSLNSSISSSSEKEKKIEITEIPATSIETILSIPALKLTSEPMMEYFSEFLNGERKKRAGINALVKTSGANLKLLRSLTIETWDAPEKDQRHALLNVLMSFDLSLTHYADSARASPIPQKKGEEGPPTCMMSLYSRILLDKHADDLGIKGYPKGNTPSMAFKNVGHVDFVFFAIEPRDAGPMVKPFKAGSRFGGHCHMIDLGMLPYFSIMTLGDLDTCNAKIGENRLSHGNDPNTAAALGFTQENVSQLKDRCEKMVTNPKMSEDAKTVITPGKTIFVRNFKTMSEQIFMGPHIKEALALKVMYDCMNFGFLNYGFCEGVYPTAGDYNVLINGLFVPQVMVPHAFCSDQVLMFEGKKTD